MLWGKLKGAVNEKVVTGPALMKAAYGAQAAQRQQRATLAQKDEARGVANLAWMKKHKVGVKVEAITESERDQVGWREPV